jgi:outer membrane protein assembly factor BamE (lipoprotein component of BamABCDE complex)
MEAGMLTIRSLALGLTGAAVLSVCGLAVDLATAPRGKTACGGSPISAEEFRAAVRDKSKQQVLQMLGRPASVNEAGAGTQYYDYSRGFGYCGPVIVDRETGMRLRSVSVWFGVTGIVNDVHLGS